MTGPLSVGSGLDRVGAIDWFGVVGRYTGRPATSLATRWLTRGEALELALAPEWEAATLEARGGLTAWLHDKCRAEYSHWNGLAAAAKPIVVAAVDAPTERLAVETGVDSRVLVDLVRWDVLAAVMEIAYERWHPPRFFVDLLAIYEAGHLPCGISTAGSLHALLFT